MAEYVYERDGIAVVVLRVPRQVWDQWEYRHQHFGKAVHALRETAIEVMAAGSVRDSFVDIPDPFFRDE